MTPYGILLAYSVFPLQAGRGEACREPSLGGEEETEAVCMEREGAAEGRGV